MRARLGRRARLGGGAFMDGAPLRVADTAAIAQASVSTGNLKSLARIHKTRGESIELIEASALKKAAARTIVEDRIPYLNSWDVLVQYLNTLAVSDGFVPSEIFEEVKTTFCYQTMTEENWNLDFAKSLGVFLNGRGLRAVGTRGDGDQILAIDDTSTATWLSVMDTSISVTSRSRLPRSAGGTTGGRCRRSRPRSPSIGARKSPGSSRRARAACAGAGVHDAPCREAARRP